MFIIRTCVYWVLLFNLRTLIGDCKKNGGKKYRVEYTSNFIGRIKHFEVGVTSSTELEAMRHIREHVSLLKSYNDQPGIVNKEGMYSHDSNSSNIEDDVLFMESFISSFSTHSNLTAPFSTNGVSIGTIPIKNNNCNSNILFDVNNEEINISVNNHILTKLIPEFDQINRTLSVIPWRVIENTIYNIIPKIQKLSYEFTLICTSISNNLKLMKYYSDDSDIKEMRWDALQMASFARGYSRYVIEISSLAMSLILIAPGSESDSSIISDIDIYSILNYPRRLLNKLNSSPIEKRYNYECVEIFGRDVNDSCVFCYTLFLTLYSRMQCQFLEIGISREAILGIKWVEEIHSHISQLNRFVFSIWSRYSEDQIPNNSHYKPPSPFISWKAFKLKLYEEFRIGLNFQQKIKQSSELDLNNYIFSKKQNNSEINNYVDLKMMDSIQGTRNLSGTEKEIIEQIIAVYNQIIRRIDIPSNEITLGSTTKLSNSIASVMIIIGTYGDKELINSTLKNMREKNVDISNDECRKLHREIKMDGNFSQNNYINILCKYFVCKHSLDFQINTQISLHHRLELAKRIMRKIIISTKNSLYEKIRDKASLSNLDENIEFNDSLTKLLSQFQTLLGLVRIIGSKFDGINVKIKEKIQLIEQVILSFEKFKLRFVGFIFNTKHYFLDRGMDGELNSISYPLSPIMVSLGPSLFDSAGNSLKKMTTKLRSKISLLNKLVTFSRNIMVKRRYTIHNSFNSHDKNTMFYSTALRIHNNRDELTISNDYTITLYKTIKKIGHSALKPIFEGELIDENYHFYFGRDGKCELKYDILSLKKSNYVGCLLYNRLIELIQIDELFSLLQRQFISIDNTERKIYYEIAVLFDKTWNDFDNKGSSNTFKNISSKLYTLKSLVENMLIFNGIAKNSLVPYVYKRKSSLCLFDFLTDSIDSLENNMRLAEFDFNSRKPRIILKNIALAFKRIFNKRERLKARDRRNIIKDIKKFSKMVLGLEPYIINIDISFKVNVEKLSFINIESSERIRKLFYLYTHCIYSTLKSTVLKGTLGKRLSLDVKSEWKEFIKRLNTVQTSLFNQLQTVLKMKNQKITIINGEVCRTTSVNRDDINDVTTLLPYRGDRRVPQTESSFIYKNFGGVSLAFLMVMITWISLGVILSFIRNSIIGTLFHLLTLFISLLTCEFTRILIAYLIVYNFDESNRLRKYLSLNPMEIFSKIDSISLVVMVLTFALLGVPMLSVNQIVNYDLLSPNWRKSLVAASGPISHLMFGGILSAIKLTMDILTQKLYLEGSICQDLTKGLRLQAFLAVINMIPLPPITDGFKVISPYLPEAVNTEISNARSTFLFFFLCTLLFIFISQSALVLNAVEFITAKLYLTNYLR
ncbi:site-2 protease family protein [Cryptosporidium felis]|nr:site-2 protease family protein [Cryptosporidium felis]